MSTSSRDASIPILTEVIGPAADGTATEAAPRPADPLEQYSVDAFEAEVLLHWTDEDWYRLERKIRERIVRQILGQIDSILEQQVRDQLADVLQVAVEGLATDIKRGLHQSLEQVITQAVAQEIARLQKTKK
jgi:hypothetical protein